MEDIKCPGFKAAGVVAGLKKDGRKDVGIIFSEVPATIAGVFTKNKVTPASFPKMCPSMQRKSTVRKRAGHYCKQWECELLYGRKWYARYHENVEARLRGS